MLKLEGNREKVRAADKKKREQTKDEERGGARERERRTTAHFTYLRNFLQALPNRAQKNRGRWCLGPKKKKNK